MRLEYYPLEKLKKEVLAIVAIYLDLKEYKVFFFGSRVLGKGDDRSDVDVGIEGPGPIPREALSFIRETVLNLPTLYKIDVVDFSDADEKFKQVAKQKIEFLN